MIIANKIEICCMQEVEINRDYKLTNRLTLINNKIEYDWLNKSWNCYKLACKTIVLT